MTKRQEGAMTHLPVCGNLRAQLETSALPTSSSPDAGSGRLASVSKRDPPVVFVFIFLNKRCYPRQGGPCVFD